MPVFAHEKESLEKFSGMDTLWNSLPEGMEKEGLQELLDQPSSQSFWKMLGELLTDAFSVGIREGVGFFFKLCALVLFAALFRCIKNSFGLKRLESAFDFLLLLGLALICFSSLQGCLQLTSASMEAIQSFFFASLPITTVLLSLSGAPASAGIMSSGLSFGLGAVTGFVTSYLSPLLNTLFAFSLVDGVMEGELGSLTAFLKKGIKVICVFFFTVVCAVLSLQNALAVAADSLAMRSVRFAAGNFIPVVGPLVGESAKTLAAAFSMVKTQCGVLCIIVLLYLILRPVLCIAVQKLVLSLAGAFSDVLGEKSYRSFLSSLSSLLDLLMALMIAESCFLIFYITLFLTNKGGF